MYIDLYDITHTVTGECITVVGAKLYKSIWSISPLPYLTLPVFQEELQSQWINILSLAFFVFFMCHVSYINVLLWTSHCTWQEHIRSIIRIKWCKPRPNKSTLFHVNKCTHLYIMLNIFCDFDVLINNVIIIYIFLFKWVHVFMSFKINYCCRNA